MTVITLANQKGGTGKTTLATNLAGLFAACGRSVVIADSDPQGSALEWSAARPAHLPSVPVVAIGASPERLRQQVPPLRGHYDVVLLDTGGRISPGVRQAVVLADFVLVPTLPSLPDVRSTERFYQQVLSEVARERPVAGAVVLNGIQASTLLSREAEQYLRQTSLPVCTAALRQFVAFRQAIALGMTVQELEPRGRAARDMQTLYDELEEEMTR